VADGECVRTLDACTCYGALTYAPGGETLASTGAGGMIKLWRTADGTCIATQTSHCDVVRSLAFSPDGQVFASGSRDETVRLWRGSDGALLRTNTVETCMGVDAVCFSPDGALLAFGRADGTVVVARSPAFTQAPAGWFNAGWNWFSIPLDPVGSSEASAVLGFDCKNSLYRWNPTVKNFELYPCDFTGLERGRSYLLMLQGMARPLYVAEPPAGDFEIALPEAGWALIGQPFDRDTLLESCLVRNNDLGVTRTAWDDRGAADAWLNWNLPWWDSAGDTWKTLALAGGDDDTLHPWYGYLVWANTRNLTLIIPDQ
jgi:hypothetical protein